ncbi:MAG: YitT family protein [Clostridia bacterium]|nr:YitT family protein [Clostridia bacterium]
MPNTTKLGKLKTFLYLNIGSLLIAVGIYFFKAPNGFASGGVSGISIILAKVAPYLSQSVYLLIMNVVLLIVGIFVLGRGCGVKTVYCTLALSLENLAFEYLLPLSAPLTDSPLLEMIYAVMLIGIGSAILFNCDASSGGTDIIALIIKKYTNMDVGKALLITDIFIAASTFVVYDVRTGLFSMFYLFTKVFVVDDIIESLNVCKAFTIITGKPEIIEEFVMNEMHHGATVYDAKGAFSGEDRKVIITVCKRMEAIKLRRKVKELDPHAFMIVTSSNEIIGKGFQSV